MIDLHPERVEEDAVELTPVAGCTLPTREQPLRVDELRTLLEQALVDVDVRGPQHAVLRLEPGAAVRVRDLVARESACCTFFAFDVRVQPDGVLLDVRVPQAQVHVLAGIVALARDAGR